jgi:hypothetical protein
MDELVPCKKCGTPYHPNKSTSSLKLTWCSVICESNELGFHLNSWINQPVKVRPEAEPLRLEEPVLA